MTPDTLKTIQEGKVFQYDEPVAPKESDPVAALLHDTVISQADPAPTKRKVKAGKTTIELEVVPETLATAPATNFQVAARPRVDFQSLIEWLIAHPGASHAEIGAAYGRNAGWFSSVLVMEEFQTALAPVRSQVDNPSVTSTLEERFQALLVRGLDVLQTKLAVPNPDVTLALEAGKLSVRALGLGASGRDNAPPPAPQPLATLADRLAELGREKRGQAIGAVPAKEVVDVVSREVKE